MSPGPGAPAPAPRGARAGVAALLVALLAAAGLACGGEPGPGSTVADSTYVAAMARLALVDTSLTGAYHPRALGMPVDSARRAVLARRGVEPEQLLRYAERWGDDPERMARTWQRIREVRDSLRQAGWRPGPGSSGGAAGEPADGGGAEARSDEPGR